MVKVTADLDPMELSFKAFKEKMNIQVDWPTLGDPDESLQIGETSIDNGIFTMHSKDITINNKHFIVQLWYRINS